MLLLFLLYVKEIVRPQTHPSSWHVIEIVESIYLISCLVFSWSLAAQSLLHSLSVGIVNWLWELLVVLCLWYDMVGIFAWNVSEKRNIIFFHFPSTIHSQLYSILAIDYSKLWISNNTFTGNISSIAQFLSKSGILSFIHISNITSKQARTFLTFP